MALPPALPLCTLVAESSRLDVGRGVAVVEVVAVVHASSAACIVDAGSVLRAREEGRASPELVAFRATVESEAGRTSFLGGPRARVVAELPKGGGTVRFVAALRGDRFVAVPLSADPAVRAGPVAFRATTSSAWGPGRIKGVARWTEVGAPVVVEVDPTRDREPPRISTTIAKDAASVPAIVVDAGAIAHEPSSPEARVAGLAKGGAAALGILLGELPFAVATAPDRGSALARMREAAQVARAASISRDPLVAAVGVRLTSAVASGFATCRRGDLELPRGWPSPPRDAVETGLLDDGETGCPRVADLLSDNHPDVRWSREGTAALLDAASTPIAALPRIGPLATARSVAPAAPVHRSRRLAWTVVLTVFALALVMLRLSAPRRSG